MSNSSEWLSDVEEALKIQNANDHDWHEETDVVIVGFGGAGAATALQALENNLSVIALDRFNGGGATAASGGVIYAGGGTALQKEAGIEDSADNMFNYLKLEVEDIVKPETLRDFCDASVETIDWLIKYGVDFRSTVWPGKTSYPGPEYFLYHSDNTLVPSYKKHATPAARGHRGYVPVEQGRKAVNLGSSLFDPMKAAALKMGLNFYDHAEARQIVLDENERVCGVKVLFFDDAALKRKYLNYRNKANFYFSVWPPILPGYSFFFKRAMSFLNKAVALESQRQSRFIRAKKGVVLSAGGFAFNKAMVNHYAPKYLNTFPLGTDGDNGAGIRLGQTANGKIDNMHRFTAWRFINPPLSFARGIIVNQQGKRFINETVYGATLGVEMGENQNGKAWLVLNKALIKQALQDVSGGKALAFQRDLARLNIWFGSYKAKTLAQLAQKIDIPADVLAQEIAAYNQAALGQQADAFGKEDKDLMDLSEGPYYAMDISLDAKLFPCPALSLGGLAVEESSGLVLNEATGQTVSGLYAAGRNAIGICSQNYLSGLSIADCVYSGRRAANHLSR